MNPVNTQPPKQAAPAATPPATTAPKQTAADTVRAMLDKSKGQIAAALPKFMDMPRFLRVAMTSIQRNPKLLECAPVTLVGAIIQSAQLGLELDGILGHAYLVPFYNGKKSRLEVQFIAGYKGLIALVRRSDQMSGIEARVVHEKDTFRYTYGMDATIEHIPDKDANPGEAIAFYAIARMKDGNAQFEVMSRTDVEKVMKRSPSKDKEGNPVGPWKSDFEEMGKKTVIRRLVKVLPVTIEAQKAVHLDERADLGLAQDLGMLVDETEKPTPGEESGEGAPTVAMPRKLDEAGKPV